MRTVLGHHMFRAGLLLVAATWLVGCGGRGRGERPAEAADALELGQMVASVAEVARPEENLVEGYGLIGGLPGTGSSNCPTGVRTYLRSYILSQLPNPDMDVDELIDSKNTAVVELAGIIPAAVSRGEKFDVHVQPAEGVDATSLRGGWLYKADLRSRGASQVGSRVLATAEGAVFINQIGTSEPTMTDGYVIGGGSSVFDYRGLIRLHRSEYATASTIRNRLNERYGRGTADAVSPTEIAFLVPVSYRQRKARFVEMVAATYLTETPELLDKRIETFVARLGQADRAEASEVALEAIGRNALPALATVLDAPSEEVRLRAARCMLSLGDDRGWGPLHAIVTDDASAYRLEALDAIITGARRNEATALARRLLRDTDVRMVLAAYEHLRQMEDVVVRQEFVGRSFYIEQVVQTDRKAIFVSRSGDPRIVIFGAPLTCRDNLFVESPDGQIVINSRQGEDYASLSRRIPERQGVLGPVRCGLTLSEIIRTLGGEPTGAGASSRGLGASYGDVTAVVEQLVAKEAVAAEFWPGPLPKIGLLVKK